MPSRSAVSQRRAARVAGFAYLLVIACGIFAEFFVRSRLIVPGDATATAANIAASTTLFRFGFASDLVMLASDVLLALAFYVLLKPVNANLALLAAFFRLVMASVLGLNLLNIFAVLLFLGDSGYLSVFTADQLHAFAMSSLEAHAMGYSIGLIFFGLASAVLGYLLFASRYVPRILAVLLLSASVVYLGGSFADVLAPRYSATVEPAYLLPFVAELSLALWLSFKGVSLGESDDDYTPAPA
jgi:hypothetical protein